MKYVRFIGLTRDVDSEVETGLFQIAYAVAQHSETSAADERKIREQLAWFDRHLPAPTRFNRTRSKGYYRRNPKGICWFKDTAAEGIARLRVLQQLVEAHGYRVTMIYEERIGYIVYEDEFQAVAEPFNETRTGLSV